MQQDRGARGGGGGRPRRPRHRRGAAATPPGSVIGSVAARPRWSVVIPAFNEAGRLPAYLDEVVSYLDTRGEVYEVVVVDDGSTDATSDVVAGLAGRCRAVRLVRLPRNLGKGAAVRAGMLEALGEYRLFSDADGATPIGELKRLEAALAAGADVAIGSRVLVAPGVVVAPRPHRVFAGRIFNWVVARLGLRNVADSQCGFKAFSAGAATDLFGQLQTDGYGFDVELLLLAQRRGFRTIEVAVNWADKEGSKVRVLTDGPRMLAQIVRARLRIWRSGGRRL